jgi:hypothetical protein
MRRKRQRWIVRTALPAAVLVAAGLFHPGPAAAQPAGAETDKCAPGDDRGVRCVQVSAMLDRAPAVGQQAALSVELRAHIDVPDVRIEIDLPAALQWSSAPAGFDVRRRSSSRPHNGGSVNQAVRVSSLAGGRTATVTGMVTAVAAGDIAVRVRVLPPDGFGLGVEEPVLLTVGADPASARLGLSAGPYRTAAVPAGATVTAVTTLPVPFVGTAGLAQPHSDDPPPSGPRRFTLSCAQGGFVYQDAAGNRHPSVNLQVQVWDDFIGDDLLAVGLTDGAGRYRVCFDNDTDPDGQDVFVRFVTQNGQWGVEWDDDPYEFDTEVRNNVGDGTTTDFGGREPGDPRLNGGLRAYDDANAAAAFTPGDCWDALDRDCRRIDINWDPDENPGTFYSRGPNEVTLTAQDADDRNVVVHELGHAVMDDVYEDDMVSGGPDCQQHELHRTETRECAWLEGFADWYGVAVFNDPVYRDTVDQNVEQNLDTPTWGSNRQDNGAAWENGDGVEGRVAGALWDLVDGPGEQPWDRFGEGLGPVWDTFLRHRSANFREYWDQRGQDGRNVGPDALASLFQNTIDYGFRDPLADHQSLTRPTPLTDHNYRFDTTKVFWSVVALRPPANADYDLRVYDDANLTQLLGASLTLTGTTDFVAINSNRRALGDYYPQVRAVSGTGEYLIEADETNGLLAGTDKVTMGPNRLAAVWDFCPAANQSVTLTVSPSDPSQDAELFVMSSDPGAPETAVRSRAAAVASASANGPGGAESVTVDLPTGCHGVIIVNRAGNGTYTLTQS